MILNKYTEIQMIIKLLKVKDEDFESNKRKVTSYIKVSSHKTQWILRRNFACKKAVGCYIQSVIRKKNTDKQEYYIWENRL